MTSVAALAFAATFTSCSKTDLYEGPEQPKTDKEKLTASFEKVIGGTICPTNDWGFGSKAATRVADTRANMWATFVEVPETLTNAQKEVVRKWFQEHNKPQGISVNWSDFFAQQVYKGGDAPTATCPESYTSAAGITGIIGSDKMNKLTCGTNEDHLNNFNKGDCSPNGSVSKLKPTYNETDHQNDIEYYTDKIQFMVNSSTECFGYHNSESSEQKNDKFVIIPGDMIDSSVAGMYFVGLDFECTASNDNQKVQADGYYSDWIIRITPGLYRGSQTYRIMCEDLIATDLDNIKDSDWDFNDVVFDARFDGNQTIIVLYAAGGTKSLTVGGVEVHEQFGVETTTMVNTENGTVNKPVAIFRLNNTYNNNKANIPVEVEGKVLTAETGKVPMKLCVPTTTKWLKERIIITSGYPDFADYAHKGNPTNWYETTVNVGSLVNK